MKGILVIGEGRMDAPVVDAEHPYLEALKSVSFSNLRKQLDKVRKEEEQALMERNLAAFTVMFTHAIERDRTASKSREETRRLYQESQKENKRLVEALSFREADLAKMTRLFSVEEQKRANLETVLENTRKEKERLEGLIGKMTKDKGELEKDKEYLGISLKSFREVQGILSRKNATLASIVTKGAEKVSLAESHLPKQMDYAKKEAVRLFLQSDEYERDASALYTVVVNNSFNLCKAQVLALLEDDDEFIPVLEKLQPEPIEGFVPEARST
ncbi:hypothetical protein Dimus_038821 [Dionaea muscipula]